MNAVKTPINWSKITQPVIKIAWALLFLTLPVTSFPYFPGGIGGKTLVQPLAIYPLIVILLLVTIPRLIKSPLPRTFLPLFAFGILAMISSVFAFSAELEEIRDVSMFARFIRNVVTLGIGGAFYLSVTLLPENWEQLKFSLRWLYYGFGVALLWGSLQALYVVHYNHSYFKLLKQLQSLVSTRKLFKTRVSGMTFEPNWFAEQIIFLLLPWLFGAVLTKQSLFKWRYKWITIEVLLLVWASGVMLFTYSRTGIVVMAILVFISFMLYRFQVAESGISKNENPRKLGRKVIEAVIVVTLILVILVAVGSQSTYFSRFWTYFTEGKARNISYIEYLAVQQRVAYWETAQRMFEAYPLIGVGLGNYAFYFDDLLPNRSWARQPEIVRQITPQNDSNRLITPKNLPGRLLAETGLIGTISFTAFVMAILGCSLFLWFSKTREQRFWSLSGFLGLLVFAFMIFSFDSFALPNMWIFFGLITAAAHLPDPTRHSEAAAP